MESKNRIATFEDAVMPHLNAAHNLARWLTRNDADADDVVQEAVLRAFKFFTGFHGQDGRAWLLAIVRNTCFTWLRANHPREMSDSFDDEAQNVTTQAPGPDALLIRKANAEMLKSALEELPVEFREAIVLRELEGMSYKEIAEVTELPIGTVMSRLARGRSRLQACLTERMKNGGLN